MDRCSRWVTVAALCALPLAARAEGKCSDDPKLWKDSTGKERLVVTWTLPYPSKAQVDSDAARKLMKDLDGSFGAEPPGFPDEYASNLREYPYPGHPGTKTVLKSVAEIRNWLKQFDMDVEVEVAPLYDQYFNEIRSQFPIPFSVYGSVVEHPPTPDNGRGYKSCTCTLQRGVALWSKGQQQLWVRSSFRSAPLKDRRNFANFAPANPLKFTFASPTIWFPLALNKALPEQDRPGYLLLDVLTDVQSKQLDESQIPSGFSYLYKGTVDYDGAKWNVERIWRKFEKNDNAADLTLPPPSALP